MKRKSLTFKFVLFNLGVLLAFSSLFLFSSNSYALELTQDVDLIRGNMIVQFLCSDCTNVTSVSGSGGTTTLVNPNVDLQGILRSVYFDLPTESYQVGDYLTLDVYIFNNANNNSLDAYVKSLQPNTNGWDLVDVSFESLGTGSSVVHFTLRNFIAGSYATILMQSTSNSWGVLNNQEFLTGGLATHWRPKSSTNYSSQIQDVVDAIESQPSYTSQLNTINNNISQLQDSVEDANDDANDRYQDEKDTIDNNAQDAQDSADSLNISFGVPWILSAWFNLFVDNDCVNIPTLKTWLHSTESQVCTPWPDNVRSTLTPIFGVLSGLFIFGFVIRWLRSGAFNGSIELS